MEIKKILSGVKNVGKGVGDIYKGTTDKLKKHVVDPVVYPISTVVASNLVLTGALKYGTHLASEAKPELMENINNAIQTSPTAGYIAGAGVLLTYGLANLKYILPLARNSFKKRVEIAKKKTKKKEQVPWRSHFKTWALIAGLYATSTMAVPAIKSEISDYMGNIKNAREVTTNQYQNNTGTIDNIIKNE